MSRVSPCGSCGGEAGCCPSGCPFTDLFGLEDGEVAIDRPEKLLAYVRDWYRFQAGFLPVLPAVDLPLPAEPGEVVHARSPEVRCVDMDFGSVMGRASDVGQVWVTSCRVIFNSPYQTLSIPFERVVHRDVNQRRGFLVVEAGATHPVYFYARTGDTIAAAFEGALRNFRAGVSRSPNEE